MCVCTYILFPSRVLTRTGWPRSTPGALILVHREDQKTRSARLNIMHFGPRQRRRTSTPRTCILSKLRERKTLVRRTQSLNATTKLASAKLPFDFFRLANGTSTIAQITRIHCRTLRTSNRIATGKIQKRSNAPRVRSKCSMKSAQLV